MNRPDSMATPDADRVDWWREARSMIVLVLLVLGVHTIVAKPFYIPSESMMPNLLTGDRLVVSKWPYGWSYSSVSFHLAPRFDGKLFGRVPARGDIAILEHPVTRQDYIKRVIGLPGDVIEMRGGQPVINGRAVQQQVQPSLAIPVDANSPCNEPLFTGMRRSAANGGEVCEVPIVRETLPNGVSYDTIDAGPNMANDDFGPYRVPAGHVFLMGDNRDGSADSRVALVNRGLGGAVPLEAVNGRAEFITFSMDGTASYLNPVSWFTAMRSGRAGTSLRPEPAPARIGG